MLHGKSRLVLTEVTQLAETLARALLDFNMLIMY